MLPETDSEDELPAGWEERTTSDGAVYYADHLGQRTQWTHPRTGRRKRVSQQLPFGWEQGGDGAFVERGSGRRSHTDPRLAFPVEEGAPRQRFDASSTAAQVPGSARVQLGQKDCCGHWGQFRHWPGDCARPGLS